MSLSDTDKLMYMTIRIECVKSNGQGSSGTGFFFNFFRDQERNRSVPTIITNKHVIKDAVKGYLTFTTADEHGNAKDTDHIVVELNNFEASWIKHPDSTVDLCALPIGELIKDLEEQGETIFYRTMDSSMIISDNNHLSSLRALEDILMIGYPIGIWDEVNNKPIARKGITATNIRFDYNGEKKFLIDAACFPGSSGSPVFIFNQGAYTDVEGNTYFCDERVLLAGILYAGPQHTISGMIEVVDIPTAQEEKVNSLIPINLGYVIKAERVLELEDGIREFLERLKLA